MYYYRLSYAAVYEVVAPRFYTLLKLAILCNESFYFWYLKYILMLRNCQQWRENFSEVFKLFFYFHSLHILNKSYCSRSNVFGYQGFCFHMSKTSCTTAAEATVVLFLPLHGSYKHWVSHTGRRDSESLKIADCCPLLSAGRRQSTRCSACDARLRRWRSVWMSWSSVHPPHSAFAKRDRKTNKLLKSWWNKAQCISQSYQENNDNDTQETIIWMS